MAAGATYEPIATTTLAATATNITFSSIAASWTDLKLVLVSQNSNDIYLRFNGDTGTNYSQTLLSGNGTAAASTRTTSLAQIVLNRSFTVSNTTPQFYSVDIFSYAGSTNKTSLIQASADYNGSGSTVSNVALWRSTAAITTVAIIDSSAGNFAIGTTATLYGIKAA